MKALVIPTNRIESFKEFQRAWCMKDWDTTIVVEDNPSRDKNFISDYHYSWKEIKEYMGDSWKIISRQDSAIRSFGFLVAYNLGADYIFSMDDDCRPNFSYSVHNWCEQHIDCLENHKRWMTSVPDCRTRGLPYDNQGSLKNVMFSMGLWSKYADLDSVQVLSAKPNDDRLGWFNPPRATRIAPFGQYFPFCGMNFAFKREATPLCFFPPMGLNSEYSRFDDIWFGVVAKKICDHLGWYMSIGGPIVDHIKMSNKFANLTKEAPGIAFNEMFWEIIDEIKLTEKTAVGCMKEMGAKLKEVAAIGYCQKLGDDMQTWASLFSQPKKTT